MPPIRREYNSSRGDDSVARRLRDKRKSAGLTLDEVARRVRDRGQAMSVSYLSFIETGAKVPSESVAVALAEALGEDVELLRSWARIRGHGELYEMARASKYVRNLLSDPEVTQQYLTREDWRLVPRLPGEQEELSLGVAGSSIDTPDTDPTTQLDSRGHLRMPYLSAPAEPGTPRVLVLADLHLAGRLLEVLKPLAHLFAFRLDPEACRRVRSRGVMPRMTCIVSRDFLPLEMGEIYAVRHQGRLQLSHLWWDQRTLVMLPDERDDDLVRIPADAQEIGKHVVGHIALLDMPLP